MSETIELWCGTKDENAVAAWLKSCPIPHPSGDGRTHENFTMRYMHTQGKILVTIEFPPPRPTLAELAKRWRADMGDAGARMALWERLNEDGFDEDSPVSFEHGGIRIWAATSPRYGISIGVM